MKNRIHFLDNLRTFLILLVVVLHAGITYEPILENTWIVSDPSKSGSIGLIRLYLDLFVMFTMFYISGYFIPYSLKEKRSWEFIKSKAIRIMLPWLVAVVTVIPVTKAIFLVSRGLPQEEWYSYFHIFQRVGGNPGFFADNPNQSWLWFLPVLFMFQMAYLLLSKTGILSMKISLKTGVILTFVAGVAYSMLISGLGLTGWYNSWLLHFQNDRLLLYFSAFLLGSLSNRLHIFDSATYSNRFYIIANVVFSVSLGLYTVVALNLFYNMIDPGRNFYFLSATLDRVVFYSSMLASMLGFLYLLIQLFHTKFNKINTFMAFLNRSSYSVYIIHLVVLGVFALFMVALNIPVYVKFLLLAILTFATSSLLIHIYNVLVKRRVYLRVLAAGIFVIAFFVITGQGTEKEEDPATGNSPLTLSETAQPETGLHEAIIKGDIDAVRQHISAGSDLDQREPAGGSSPLITAALFGNTEAARALTEAGASVNLQNNDGSTALHTAAFFCRPAIVKLLLENGADTSLKNNTGSTALETVTVPFDKVEGIYDYFASTLGPLGLKLDHGFIQKTRPEIAGLLK